MKQLRLERIRGVLKELMAFARGDEFSTERRMALATEVIDLLSLHERKQPGRAPSPTPTKPHLIVMERAAS